MPEVVSRSIWQPRLYAILFGIFAAVALLLAVVGIYGVMSYSVMQRTHDVGIRMAIGAQVSDVLRLILTQGLKLTLIGIAIGLVTAFGLTRWMKSLLFGVKPFDPWTFAVIAVVLLVVALVACLIPAHRATKVDPLVALRCE